MFNGGSTLLEALRRVFLLGHFTLIYEYYLYMDNFTDFTKSEIHVGLKNARNLSFSEQPGLEFV